MRFLSAIALISASAALASAENWPAWRGPTGQGYSTDKNAPLEWSATKNVKWKIPLAWQGNSTPIVWNNRIFMTEANTGGTVRSLLCFDRANGKKLWQKDVKYDKKERNWTPNWYANASPTTDGKLVYACFGSAGLYCYDFDGKEIWKRTDLGEWQHAFGNSASPVLYEDLVIQWCGPNEKEGKNYLLAVNKTDGKTVWQTEEKAGSWSTPVLVTIDGKDQMLLGTDKFLKSFDPRTGSELWRCDGLNTTIYTSALYADGVAIGMTGYGRSSLAVKVGGTGDITKDRLWFQPKPANQRVGSGIIVGEHCYIIDDNGLPRCYELKTGKNLWEGEEAIKPGTWGSFVHADGKLYNMLKDGSTVVLAAKPKFEILATNKLDKGSKSNSSPVISDGEIYLRTFTHLWCIKEQK